MYKYIKTKILVFHECCVSIECNVSTNFKIQQKIPLVLY